MSKWQNLVTMIYVQIVAMKPKHCNVQHGSNVQVVYFFIMSRNKNLSVLQNLLNWALTQSLTKQIKI